MLTPEQIVDFVNLTIARFRKRSWVDISLNLQYLIFVSRMFKSKTITERGGTQLEIKVQHTNNGSFRYTGLFNVDNLSVRDLTTKGFVQWSMQDCHFMYDVQEELFQGDDMTRIVSELDVRDHSMHTDFFLGMEYAMWLAPTSSSVTPRRPYGIPFWIQKSATKEFGFNGGDPSGFANGAAELPTATYPGWKNGTFAYNSITENDGLRKWAEAAEKCNFQAPHDFNELGKTGTSWEYFTTYPVLDACERFLRASNDNLGTDLAKYRGSVLFKGNPVTWVPALTNSTSDAVDTSNPIYGINWNLLRWVFLRGRNMVKSKSREVKDMHNTYAIFMDNAGQFECLQRRGLFVGQQVST